LKRGLVAVLVVLELIICSLSPCLVQAQDSSNKSPEDSLQVDEKAYVDSMHASMDAITEALVDQTLLLKDPRLRNSDWFTNFNNNYSKIFDILNSLPDNPPTAFANFNKKWNSVMSGYADKIKNFSKRFTENNTTTFLDAINFVGTADWLDRMEHASSSYDNDEPLRILGTGSGETNQLMLIVNNFYQIDGFNNGLDNDLTNLSSELSKGISKIARSKTTFANASPKPTVTVTPKATVTPSSPAKSGGSTVQNINQNGLDPAHFDYQVNLYISVNSVWQNSKTGKEPAETWRTFPGQVSDYPAGYFDGTRFIANLEKTVPYVGPIAPGHHTSGTLEIYFNKDFSRIESFKLTETWAPIDPENLTDPKSESVEMSGGNVDFYRVETNGSFAYFNLQGAGVCNHINKPVTGTRIYRDGSSDKFIDFNCGLTSGILFTFRGTKK
jgi:hypothetical protein